MKEVNVKKKKRSHKKISKLFAIILAIVILILFGMVFYLNLIPIFWTILLFIVTIIISGGITLCSFHKMRIIRLIGYLLSIIIIVVSIFIIIYLYNTLGFLFNITNGDYAIKTYNVLVLKESSYNKIKDLDNKFIGISETMDEDSLDQAKKTISKKIQLIKLIMY